MSRIKYEMILKIKSYYECDKAEPIENIKSNTQYANDIAQIIMDEIAQAGGVGVYDVIISTVDVR